jgi:hypothetical protein
MGAKLCSFFKKNYLTKEPMLKVADIHFRRWQDVNMVSVVQELLPVLPGISSKILPDVLSRLSSRVFARLIREAFL